MARETINGISVPVPGTGEPADFQGDLRRLATDLPASIEATTVPLVDAGVAPVAAGLTAIQGQASVPVLAKFVSPIAEVALTRVSTDSYRMERNLGAQIWERWALQTEAGVPGGTTTHKMDGCNIETPVLTLNNDAAAIAYTGTWAIDSNVNAYGGNLHRSTLTGDSLSWATPDRTVKVALRVVTTAARGLQKVTIDGDATRATLLPTAQQLVDDGVAASTILAANGGPFQPTDRVLNSYTAATNWDNRILLADDLTLDIHTVVVTRTAVQATAATGSGFSLGGVEYATDQTTISTAGASWLVVKQVTPAPAGIESAISIWPTGASAFTMVGTTHGYEDETSLTFTMDGVTITPTVGQRVLGQALGVARRTNLRHPQTGATVIAQVDYDYSYTRFGLQMAPTIRWQVNSAVTATLLGMFNLTGSAFIMGRVDSDPTVFTLTANDNSYASQARGQAAWLWESGQGRAAAILAVLDPDNVMNGWRDGDGRNDPAAGSRFLALQDRASANGLGHKIYASRVGVQNIVNVTAGDVWEAGAGVLYATNWFPRNPGAFLSVA